MIVKADYRITELKDYILKADEKNAAMRKLTEESFEENK